MVYNPETGEFETTGETSPVEPLETLPVATEPESGADQFSDESSDGSEIGDNAESEGVDPTEELGDIVDQLPFDDLPVIGFAVLLESEPGDEEEDLIDVLAAPAPYAVVSGENPGVYVTVNGTRYFIPEIYADYLAFTGDSVVNLSAANVYGYAVDLFTGNYSSYRLLTVYPLVSQNAASTLYNNGSLVSQTTYSTVNGSFRSTVSYLTVNSVSVEWMGNHISASTKDSLSIGLLVFIAIFIAFLGLKLRIRR